MDYTDVAQVQAYDARHQWFRDYQIASEIIIKKLDLGPEPMSKRLRGHRCGAVR